MALADWSAKMKAGEISFGINVGRGHTPADDHGRGHVRRSAPTRTGRPCASFFMQNTLMFNGYADQVASMYAGMYLPKF